MFFLNGLLHHLTRTFCFCPSLVLNRGYSFGGFCPRSVLRIRRPRIITIGTHKTSGKPMIRIHTRHSRMVYFQLYLCSHHSHCVLMKRYGMEIDGFIPKMLVEHVPGSRGGCLSENCFCIWTLLGCTTCFRMYFAGKAGRKDYLFTKKVSILSQT